MKELKGNSIAGGLAAGRAVYITRSGLEIPQHHISEQETGSEADCYLNVIAEAEREVEEYLSRLTLNSNEQDIINAHLEIIRDPELKDIVLKLIKKERHNVAKAIHTAFEQTILFFKSMENEVFAQRSIDFEDVRNRLLRKVLKLDDDPFAMLSSETIPIFHEIRPSEVSLLSKAGVSAYISEIGSYTSHAAILSRALNIACVTNILELRQHIAFEDSLVVDGDMGTVIVDPDVEALEYYAQKLQIRDLIHQKQLSLRSADAVTKNGRTITLSINIGLPEEIEKVAELNGDGVGLFRTEFLFLSRNNLPDEEEQYNIYRELAEKTAPYVLTIRTFDLGGDKLSHLIPAPREENPYLGNRGIRFSLSHPQVLRTQLRAIIRASVHGKIRIMFPMIIDVDDFLEAKRIYQSCADELYEEGVEFDYEIPIGTMVEIPSAALSSDALAKECDFLSIGTNDLVQYTLAVDRNNDMVNRYFIQHHPAVLKLIRATITNAAKHRRSVSVCGEMASIPEYVPLLIGMGINELSVNPAAFYEVKRIIRNCDDKLERIIKNFDFSTSLPHVDDLVYRSLKPYYSEKRTTL
jgi:phosphotransferase system enzyme I (PtsI)